MAQTTTTTDHPSDDAAHALTAQGQSQGRALRLAHHTAPPAMKRLASGPAAAELFHWNETLVRFWLEQANQQVVGTAQTQMRLVGARGWRERVDIQSSFVSDSFGWLNAGLVCYAAVTSAMIARAGEPPVGPPAAALI